METRNDCVDVLSDADHYAAVSQRDGTFDGLFYYGLQTTGVYCRPSCAARLALRKNMSFYLSCEAAERAGFRACKRCRPTEPSQSERYAEIVRQACRLIDQAEEIPSLEDVARDVGVSPYHFHRVFKQITGVTPKGYANARRAARLQDSLGLLGTVTNAIYDAGFNAPSRFYESATGRLGMTPGAYRKVGLDVSIHFAVAQCSLGAILVATTEKGVCAISFSDDPDTLVRDLQDRFPKADLLGGDTEFEKLVARVVGFVEAPGQGLDLPLDIRGTVFQQRVWEACGRSLPEPPPVMLGLRLRSVRRLRCGPWRRRAPATLWLWLSPATGSSVRTVRCQVTVGASSANARVSTSRHGQPERPRRFEARTGLRPKQLLCEPGRGQGRAGQGSPGAKARETLVSGAITEDANYDG